MKLNRATISNFRSISELRIDFEHGCQILLGINESGKSNILRALHLLDPEAKVSPADLRIERSNEDQVTAGYVRFEVSLDEEELEQIYAEVSKSFATGSLNKELVSGPEGKLTLRSFLEIRANVVHEVKIPSGERKSTYYALPKNRYSILPGWAKLAAEPAAPATAVATRLITFVGQAASIDTRPERETFDAEAVNGMIGSLLNKHVAAHLPQCIFWRYSDAYLLPSSIDVASFAASPNSCVPLRSIFELANYDAESLATVIPQAQAQSQHRYISLLRKASEAATKHIRRVWKDHKSIRIDLHSNGPLLVPLIIDDEVPLDMASRSDGFKRFVSFLLQISAKVHTAELKNVLLLVDEPEIALHPAGARNLMRELTDIGQTNAVMYSTHSIFMVDQSNIARHLIVEKKDEITVARKAEKSRIQDEEVLYAAMGYSIFETLKKKNIIFEGWRDKEIFRIARDALIKADKEVRDELLDLGLTFAEGVKDVKTVAKILQLADRGCLIISDADSAALGRRKEYEKPGAPGTWITLVDILGAGVATTGEDLILRESIIKRANKFRSAIPGLPALTDNDFPGTQPTMSALKVWLAKAGEAGEDAEDALKIALYENLKREELSDRVNDLVHFARNHNFST